MKKEIDINSEEWCNLIFKGRNKKYGAYYLRKTSEWGYIWGFIFMLVFSGLAIFCLSKTINNETTTTPTIIIDGGCRWGEDFDTFELPELPAPPKIQSDLYNFIVPKITPDSLVVKMHSYLKEEGILYEEGTFTPFPFFTPIEVDEPLEAIELEDISRKICSFPFNEISDPHPLPEQEAQFPGGNSEFIRFFASNIRYPYSARETEAEGLAVAKFLIQKNGSVGNIQIVSGLNYACDNEVIKVIKKMPRWIPAKQNGKSICTSFILPVRFALKNGNI